MFEERQRAGFLSRTQHTSKRIVRNNRVITKLATIILLGASLLIQGEWIEIARGLTECLSIYNLTVSCVDGGNVRDKGLGKSRVSPARLVSEEEAPLSHIKRIERNRTAWPVFVIYSADESCLPGVEASIRSVMKHASGLVTYFFIGDKPLLSMPDVNFVSISDIMEQHNLTEFMNLHNKRSNSLNVVPHNYVRFAMESFLPKQSKAMWIDADTIVTCDVVSLVKGVLNDDTCAVAAVPRKGGIHGLTKKGKSAFRHINTSFNAGMYVVNLENWQQQKLTEEIRLITLRNKKEYLYHYGSQPPLAIVVGEKFEHLHQAWNIKSFDRKKTGDAFLKEACLVHWKGKVKPWSSGGLDGHVDLWEALSDSDRGQKRAFPSTQLLRTADALTTSHIS